MEGKRLSCIYPKPFFVQEGKGAAGDAYDELGGVCGTLRARSRWRSNILHWRGNDLMKGNNSGVVRTGEQPIGGLYPAHMEGLINKHWEFIEHVKAILFRGKTAFHQAHATTKELTSTAKRKAERYRATRETTAAFRRDWVGRARPNGAEAELFKYGATLPGL